MAVADHHFLPHVFDIGGIDLCVLSGSPIFLDNSEVNPDAKT